MPELKLFKHLHSYPPALCFLLSKKRGQPMSIEDISKSSGLNIGKTIALCNAMSWQGVDVYELHAFAKACGIDFLNARSMNRAECYVRHTGTGLRTPFARLSKSPDWDTVYLPLIVRWLRSQAEQSPLRTNAIQQLIQRLDKLKRLNL